MKKEPFPKVKPKNWPDTKWKHSILNIRDAFQTEDSNHLSHRLAEGWVIAHIIPMRIDTLIVLTMPE